MRSPKLERGHGAGRQHDRVDRRERGIEVAADQRCANALRPSGNTHRSSRRSARAYVPEHDAPLHSAPKPRPRVASYISTSELRRRRHACRNARRRSAPDSRSLRRWRPDSRQESLRGCAASRRRRWPRRPRTHRHDCGIKRLPDFRINAVFQQAARHADPHTGFAPNA